MENESSKSADNAQDEKQNSDAAAMSARILALQGDSDEYTYTDPLPRPVPPIGQARAKRKSLLGTLVIAAVMFAAGGLVGNRMEKRKLHPPAAVVNGEIVSADDFAHASEMTSGRATLQRLIDDKLVLQFAKKKGITPDQKAVDARYTELTRTPGFFQNLKRNNQTPDDYKYLLFIVMCKQAIVSNGVKVNPSEIMDYYKHNIDPANRTARFFHPETVQVQVIVTTSKEAADAAQKDLNTGMQFTAAVMKYSVDVSKNRGGVLSPIKKGTVNTHQYPGLDKLLFDLQTNQTSPPTRIAGNYWIVHCMAHVPESTDSFDKVQEDCTQGLLVERGVKTHGDEIKKEEQEFVKAATISITNDQYADVSPKLH